MLVHIVIEWPLFTSISVTISSFLLQDLSALIIPAALKPPSKPWMGFKLEWSDSKYNLRGQKRPADPTREKKKGSRKKRNEKKKSPQAKVKTEHSVRIWSFTFHKSIYNYHYIVLVGTLIRSLLTLEWLLECCQWRPLTVLRVAKFMQPFHSVTNSSTYWYKKTNALHFVSLCTFRKNKAKERILKYSVSDFE